MNKLYIPLLFIFASCSNSLEGITTSDNPVIKKVIDDASTYEVQILYTQIDTTDAGDIAFTDYAHQVNEDNYFYPANTIKLPMVIIAAEYFEAQEHLSIYTPYAIEGDPLKHTAADDMKAIFTVSDNDAYNRLYELLGRDYINKRLGKLDLSPTRISHRLETNQADIPQHKKISFFPGYASKAIEIKRKDDKPISKLKLDGIKKGKGFIIDETLVSKKMDFSEKNYFPIEAQQEFMKRLVFPEFFSKNKQFKINDQIRLRLLDMMHNVPKNKDYTTDYYDNYVKFFMYGDSKKPIPNHIKIYNKVGYNFGTLTETAYIEDTKNNVRFILSASILVNKNNIFNDDIYEYDEIGIPFLAQLGREIYDLELDREK